MSPNGMVMLRDDLPFKMYCRLGWWNIMTPVNHYLGSRITRWWFQRFFVFTAKNLRLHDPI